jgi:hypothetical protein
VGGAGLLPEVERRQRHDLAADGQGMLVDIEAGGLSFGAAS